MARKASPKTLIPDVCRAMFTAIYVEEEDGFTGFVEELMGLTARGATLNEARERLEAAAQAFVHVNRAGIRFRMIPTRGLVHREAFSVEV